MPLLDTSRKYGHISQILHWLMVLLIAVMYAIAWGRDLAPPEWRGQIIDIHKSIGLVILTLFFARLAWKFLTPSPSPAPQDHKLQAYAAAGVHALLYLMFLALPICGWLMVSSFGRPLTLFGLFDVPPLLDKNRDLAIFFKEAHEVLAYGFAALIGLHIAAALYHHFVKGDNLLARMLPLRTK